MDQTNHQIYCSFLLRIWVEPDDDGSWRYSLEDTQTGKRTGFTSLETLCQHIEKMVEENGDSGAQRPSL